jgi:hypothetical protein
VSLQNIFIIFFKRYIVRNHGFLKLAVNTGRDFNK